MKKYKDANGEPCKYRYYVIGNSRMGECFGGSDYLRGARIIAGRHERYNGYEWIRPDIYKAEETEMLHVVYVGVPFGGLGSRVRYRAPTSNARPLPDFAGD